MAYRARHGIMQHKTNVGDQGAGDHEQGYLEEHVQAWRTAGLSSSVIVALNMNW